MLKVVCRECIDSVRCVLIDSNYLCVLVLTAALYSRPAGLYPVLVSDVLRRLTLK